MDEKTKDSKSLVLLLFPIGLLFLSIIILFGLGFRFYYKEPNPAAANVIIKADPTAVANGVRDSLQKIYTTTIKQLDSRLDSIWNNTDTLAGNLDLKLNEFYKLRKEITSILKTGSTSNDYSKASQKIGELQQKVAMLSQHNQDIENENKRLNDLIAQLNQPPKQNEALTNPRQAQNNKPPESEKNITLVNNKPDIKPDNLTASDIRLTAVKLSDEREVETSDAEQAEKLVATFVVKNNYTPFNDAEVEVVVTQPDGQVLQQSAWETGTFNTPEGRKIYSGKMRFEYLKGETKRLRLSLTTDKFLQGNYIMHLYHNGILIGRAVKQLT